MTTFNTQRGDPQIAEAETRLLDILQRLGQQRIPDLEVEDFLEDLQNDAEAEPRKGKLEACEEETAVKLLLRILEQVVRRVFNKLTNVTESLEKTSLEKLRVEEENKCLEKEVKSLKSKLRTTTVAKTEMEKLRSENARLKALLDSKSKSPEPEAAEISVKKRKKSPLFDAEKVAASPNMQRSGSVIFQRTVSPTNVSLLHSTAAHLDDTSFVPETLEVASSPGCRKSTKFRGNRTVPDTPEKDRLSPSANIEVCVSPVAVVSRNRKTPTSPLITSTKKRKLIRIESSKENRIKANKTEAVKISKVKRSKPSTSTEERNILKLADDSSSLNSKKVGKIDPGAQSEINRKSFQQFEDDFPKKKTSKRSEHFRNIPSDTDSDFESPNLLKRQRLRKTEEAGRKNELKIKKIFEADLDEDIEVFDSQIEEEEKPKAQPRKGKSSSVRSENRWGIEVGLPRNLIEVKTHSCFSTLKSCRTPTRSLSQRSRPK